MAKGTKYDQQFKENAVRYRLDHPELTLKKAAESLRRTQSGIVWIIRNSHSRKRLKIWESVILLSKRGSGQPRNMKAVCQQEDPAIIPVMRQKRSPVSNES